MITNGKDAFEEQTRAQPRPRGHPWVVSMAVGTGIWVGLHWICDNIEIEAGESAPLRWARKLGEHPLRGSVAIGLLVRALEGF